VIGNTAVKIDLSVLVIFPELEVGYILDEVFLLFPGTMSTYGFDEEEIRSLVQEYRMTHDQIFRYLETKYGGQGIRGLSTRSVKRFCKLKGISRRSGVSNAQLHDIVLKSVTEVGPYYGYRTLKGHIEYNYASNVAEKRIQKTMKIVDPLNSTARLVAATRKLNPKTYHAPYFGYNLHMDQNEKVCGCVYEGFLAFIAHEIFF
jgi:hypothetical protein